jgi:hypothetical protein
MQTVSVGSVFAALTMTACATSQPDLVRARAASDLSCAESHIAVREVREIDAEDTLYEVSACGRVAQYRCTLTETGPQPDTRIAGQMPRAYTSCVALAKAGGVTR